ncbi:MAG: MBOAT family protein [Paraburkholderia sp.]|uniref:MBOAT family O-acyltransferase n=1 Tax=Paraburkholderia sp. TaxID=1926495 RepID=UPI0011F6BD97|nr:MBOAT family O-acyltransferase [Paraburkholderia sp.]TAL97278.1 MAG: MBOAT family protein [Paraburkholderia sp.]
MVFSSPVFLFIFFPLFYVGYFFLPKQFRNGFVLLSSICFYTVGAGALTAVVAVLILFNYASGLLIFHLGKSATRAGLFRLVTTVAIVLNLGPLIFFKYLLFLNVAIGDIFGFHFIHDIKSWKLALPLGISFYTFHFISYLVDVYAHRVRPENSLRRFAIYIALFPHLIAGPVVRFAEIKVQLDRKRRILVGKDIFWGLVIFVIGLAKKILLADSLGSVVDFVHGHNAQLTTYSAWLAAVCYSFQIYFDFSGYTDMAIGMARMMGFRFPRNFNRPYMSLSVTEFWQRWHMTLSRWFRDYVYIPLGGSRHGAAVTYRNLLIVFVLCAMWHGAAYTFLVWGVGHGALLCAERSGILKTEKLQLGCLPVFVLVTLLWVPFRAEDLTHMSLYWSTMFGLNPAAQLWADANRSLADPKVIVLLIAAMAICLTSHKPFYRLRSFSFRHPRTIGAYCFLLYVLSCISAVEHGFNPFIYFQF